MLKITVRNSGGEKEFWVRVSHFSESNRSWLATGIPPRHCNPQSDTNQSTAGKAEDLSKLGRYSYKVTNILVTLNNRSERSTIVHFETAS
jgi:hypothetical protein